MAYPARRTTVIMKFLWEAAGGPGRAPRPRTSQVRWLPWLHLLTGPAQGIAVLMAAFHRFLPLAAFLRPRQRHRPLTLVSGELINTLLQS